jgi:hypothetical protein
MIRSWLGSQAEPLYPSLALILFVSLFGGVVYFLARSKKEDFKKQEGLPLEDDTHAI